MRDYWINFVNSNGSAWFCDASSNLPQDSLDTGFVPSSDTAAKVEDFTAKAVGKLVTAEAKCHIKAASSLLRGLPFDEDQDCGYPLDGYSHSFKFKDNEFPPCLWSGPGSAWLVGVMTLDSVDANNDLIYCAQ